MLHPTCCTGKFDKNLVLETRKFHLIHLKQEIQWLSVLAMDWQCEGGWPVIGEDVTIWQFKTIDFYRVIVLTLDRNLMSIVLQGLSHLAHCQDLLKQFLFCTI